MNALGRRSWVGWVCLRVMLRSPLGCHFICPFDVARLEDKYLATVLALRCGAPVKKPTLIALMSKAMGGLHRLWCMNFTALVLVVRWNEKIAHLELIREAVGMTFTGAGSWRHQFGHSVTSGHGDICWPLFLNLSSTGWCIVPFFMVAKQDFVHARSSEFNAGVVHSSSWLIRKRPLVACGVFVSH